jgi:hypothetical protein
MSRPGAWEARPFDLETTPGLDAGELLVVQTTRGDGGETRGDGGDRMDSVSVADLQRGRVQGRPYHEAGDVPGAYESRRAKGIS